MAVKYVKDFAFDSGFGFSGSSGKTPVRAYMRGGAVKGGSDQKTISKAGPKAPSIAPAMVGKRSKGLGGLAPETKKLAAYDKPHLEGKKGAKVAQYAKGGAVKKAHAKKEMPSFLKAKMMKKAEGGPVAEITPSDGMSPLQEIAIKQRDPGGAIPIWQKLGMSREEYLKQAGTTYDTKPSGAKAPMYGGLLETAPREDIGQPIGALTPLPEEPVYAPDVFRRRDLEIQDRDPGLKQKRLMESRLDRALARNSAMQERAGMTRDMRQDRMTQARDIMDRYIGGERNAMPRRSMAPGMRGMAESKARRAMPVAPRAPMIDRSAPQPYMPNLRSFSAEELAEYSKGKTFSPEGRYAKGGRVSKGEKKIGKVMGEFKRGELHSGSKKGPVVTNPKQATAIALSEARAAGAKIPKKKAMGGRACG